MIYKADDDAYLNLANLERAIEAYPREQYNLSEVSFVLRKFVNFVPQTKLYEQLICVFLSSVISFCVVFVQVC